MRTFLISTLLLAPLAACDTAATEDGGADIAGADGKADGGPGIEVTARLKPGSIDIVMTPAMPRLGYVFYAAEGAKVGLEVTHGGSDNGLDTLLKVYGPRLADGTYPKTLASDDDSGYGKLSRIRDLQVSIGGFYLVELANGPSAAQAADGAHGSC